MSKTKWTVDPSHSEIFFKVKHLMITNIRGEFENFNIDVESEGDDFSNAKVAVTIDADSVFTRQKDRDKHLKSADFFDTENHPELKFESTNVEKLDEDNYKLSGNFTIKDVIKPVTLDVEFGGIIHDPVSGFEKAGFTLSGKINRTNWGLNYNAALETGGVLVGEEIRIIAEIQLIKHQAEKAA